MTTLYSGSETSMLEKDLLHSFTDELMDPIKLWLIPFDH